MLFLQEYANIFMDNGYENTNFLGMLTEKDLKRLGIKKVAHRRNLLRKIQDIPEFKIPIDVPVCISNFFINKSTKKLRWSLLHNWKASERDMYRNLVTSQNYAQKFQYSNKIVHISIRPKFYFDNLK